LINGAAQAADDAPDFSERIRAGLPTGSSRDSLIISPRLELNATR
jgi:hypothetical protein